MSIGDDAGAGPGPVGRAIAVLFPDSPRRVPHERWINIAFRSVHLLASGILLGGHTFGMPAALLRPWLVLTVATGIGLIAIEVYRSCHWLYMAQGVLVVFKVVLTALAGLWWDQRVALLALVVVVGSVGSHMSARYRHYSVVHRRELTYPAREES
jgi:hypothetical protein